MPIDSEAAQVVFTDASLITIEPGTHIKIGKRTRHGAKVVLAQGQLKLAVVHRLHAAWSIAAGPFLVQVIGTRFTTAWRPVQQILTVAVFEGSVRIKTPASNKYITIQAGQRFIAENGKQLIESLQKVATPKPTVKATTSAAEIASSVDNISTPDVDLLASKKALTNAHTSTAKQHHQIAWDKLVSEGQYEKVLQQAQQEGIAKLLHQGPMQDLTALADASRYMQRYAIADKAYRSIRARYPNSTQARIAAFTLGRMIEDQGGKLNTAILWYQIYLQESPQGYLATEAIGRCMVLYDKIKRFDLASDFAQQYLKHAPYGPYADSARRLLHSR